MELFLLLLYIFKLNENFMELKRRERERKNPAQQLITLR